MEKVLTYRSIKNLLFFPPWLSLNSALILFSRKMEKESYCIFVIIKPSLV